MRVERWYILLLTGAIAFIAIACGGEPSANINAEGTIVARVQATVEAMSPPTSDIVLSPTLIPTDSIDAASPTTTRSTAATPVPSLTITMTPTPNPTQTPFVIVQTVVVIKVVTATPTAVPTLTATPVPTVTVTPGPDNSFMPEDVRSEQISTGWRYSGSGDGIAVIFFSPTESEQRTVTWSYRGTVTQVLFRMIEDSSGKVVIEADNPPKSDQFVLIIDSPQAYRIEVDMLEQIPWEVTISEGRPL